MSKILFDGEWTPIRFDDDGEPIGPLPEDGQDCLVSFGSTVMTDRFWSDEIGCGFEFLDMNDVSAWMPLPDPY